MLVWSLTLYLKIEPLAHSIFNLHHYTAAADISDPVYTFCEIMDHIDLSRYFVEKGYKTGRPRCDAQKLLKVILFAFMENGICSLREIEKLCRNDIRYMYLLDGMKTPSFVTFGNLIRNELTDSVEQIFADINAYIFAKDHVDL